MKRIVTGALALLLITGVAQAQNAAGKKERHKHPMEQLNLTAEQEAKMKTMREAHRKQWQELQKQDNITVKEWKARRQELIQKQRSEVNSVLTAEQQQQLAKVHGQQRKGMKGKAMRQKGAMAISQLNLTEVQQSKMKAVHQDYKTKRTALRSNTTLAEAQKKEQIKALAQQHRQEVKAILTPEQQQKMDALRQERRNKTGK